jgi:biotin synthase
MSTVVDYNPRSSQPPPPPTGANEAVEKQRAEKRKQILREAVTSTQVRHDWTKDEIAAIYYQPVLELAYQAVSDLFFLSSCHCGTAFFETAGF